jgi:uncharacterized FlaG/YvyC family protein
MAKLHELLAVEGNLQTQSNAVRTELMATFTSKRHLFEEKRSTFTPNTDGAAAKTESQSDIQSTVSDEIKWISEHISKALDATYAVDVANTNAFADVVLEDGTKVLEKVPATALLEMEKRLGEVHQLIKTIPTLDPAKGFTLDPDHARKAFKAREVRKNRTAKVQEPLVLAPATDKHPAQVQLITKDVVVGEIHEQEWSGMITPSTKAELIERCEDLQRSVKKARARANNTEIDQASNKIGQKLLSYIFQPLKA